VWDILGIAAILGSDARGYTPCGCGECDEKLDLQIKFGKPIESDWIVHFLVPAKQFWDQIGYT